MEAIGILVMYVLAPFETFLKLGIAGTLSKFIGLVVLAVFFLRLVKEKNVRIPAEGWSLLVFILFGALSSTWARFPDITLARGFTLTQLFGLYLITLNVFGKNEGGLQSGYLFICLSGLGLSLYMIFQAIKMGTVNQWLRVSISRDVDVNHLASFFIPSALLSLHFIFYKSRKYWVAFLVILSAIFLTQSRGAVIALIMSVGLYFFAGVETIKVKIRFIVISIISALVVWYFVPSEFFSRTITMFADKQVLMSGSGRNIIWGWAWDEFKARPLLGMGLGNFTVKYRPPHSSFFQILSEQGLLGIGMISSFLFCLFRFGINENRRDGVNVERIIVIALIIMSLTVDTFYQKYVWVWLGIVSARKTM